MKKLHNRRVSLVPLFVLLLLGLALAACDNQVNIGPTEPEFSAFTPTEGGLRTLSITGTLVADQGSCVKATILFDGLEINGARSKCQSAQGCTELHLAGVVSAPAGHHTITFKVLRQSADIEDYLATGAVGISGLELDFLEPVSIELRPTRAALQAGEGVSFDLNLYD